MTTFFPDQDIIEVLPEQLESLKKAAGAAPLRRARLCLHPNEHDPVHEMVIVMFRDSYNGPHRHRDKSESFHVIEGRLVVVLFDDQGNVTRRIRLGPPGSGETFLYRLPKNRWHTIVPLTEYIIIHEATTGPFAPGQVEFASWAPDGKDAEEVRHFRARLACG